MVNLFKGRRKSSGNAIEDLERENEKLTTPPEPVAPVTDSGGFKVLSQSDVAAKKEMAMRKAQAEKEKPRFGRFSGFGSSNNKGRQQSMDDDSPSSSKRDSKSSSGTQFSSNRPYHVGQFGSTSTLPSSADTDMNSDNMFSNLPPRPYISQHNSSPSGLSMGGMKKALPQIPPPSKSPDTHSRYYSSNNENSDSGRSRALTTSSYASTAIPPKLDSDLNFGGTFDDLFSGLDKRRNSPDFVNAQGRSLLDGKRNQPDPIRIDRKLDVEPPLASWESRGSADNLMSPTADDDDSPLPPPVPPHKYGQYAPVSSHSPDLNGSNRFEDADARYTRDSVISRRSTHEHSPESKPANSIPISTPHQTPLSSRTAHNNSTPLPSASSPLSPTSPTEEDDNMFAPSRTMQTTVRKPTLPVLKENIPPPPSVPGEPNRKVLTAAEFKAQKAKQLLQPRQESSDEEDYEDEEEEIRKREEEQLILRKKQQQMQMARDALKRTTTAPPDANRNSTFAGNGFPSEVSLNADDWSDEDVPLGVLAHHVGPKRNEMFSQLPNATPSYFPNATPSVIDRPASAGALGNNRASTYKPVFARNLPDDPYAGPQFIGSGLVRPSNRESMGFNNRAQSVYGEPTGLSMSYPEPTPQFPTLVGQIQMRESSKQKYMGGASSKQLPVEGPFTGALGAQMNGMNQPATRMSQMPMQNNMMGMNPMMMNNGMGMGMMGMGQMYPQGQNPQMEQMQAMLMAQQSLIAQMQAQQYGMNGQGMPQDPRMSMFPNQMPGFPNPSMNGSMPNLGSTMQNQRPMSIMSGVGNQPFPQQQRPYSTFGGPGLQPGGGFQHQPGQMHLGPPNGYTASIAPSERSNIGMSSRYRPVTTGNGFQNDQMSTVSSQTLQASGGASDSKKVRGILKNRSVSTQLAPQESEEDDWSKMRSRKSKFVSNKEAPATASAFDDIDARAVY